MPQVAVVVATWNRAALLAEALASVRAQTFADWECLVAVDGSTDGTGACLEQWVREEPRIRALHLPHGGVHGRVRNAALRETTAPLVAFLDDDDLWLPHTLARQLDSLAADPAAALVCGRVDRFGEDLGVWPRRPAPARLSLAHLLRGNVVPFSTVMARREALAEAGLFPEDVEATPDYELWLRVARRHPLCARPDVLARYRVHAGNMSHRRGLEVTELERLYDRLEREWGLPRRALAPARRGLARARARAAPRLADALRHWVRALAP
jgi:glycosyltransferase involved in cell wall biosynthesis